MTVSPISYIEHLPEELDPIRREAEKYIDDAHTFSNMIRFQKSLWIGADAYGIILYPGSPGISESMDRLQEMSNIPVWYQKILDILNGCYIYDMVLFGIPESPSLDRQNLNPLDIHTANQDWIREFSLNSQYTYIGGAPFNDEENIGYFIDEVSIYSIRENGEVIQVWDTFSLFLRDEIKKAHSRMLFEKET